MTRESFIQRLPRAAALTARAFSSGFGTIYTAAYHPAEGRAEYLWPGFTLSQSFDGFVESEHTQAFDPATV